MRDERKMIVRINNREKKEIELKKRITISELLKSLNLRRESVVVIVNNEIRVEEEEVKDSDEIRIVSAVSGG